MQIRESPKIEKVWDELWENTVNNKERKGRGEGERKRGREEGINSATRIYMRRRESISFSLYFMKDYFLFLCLFFYIFLILSSFSLTLFLLLSSIISFSLRLPCLFSQFTPRHSPFSFERQNWHVVPLSFFFLSAFV